MCKPLKPLFFIACVMHSKLLIMAVYRETPKCPWCGKVIAKPIMKIRMPWQAPVYGDDFERWEYSNHKCKKAPKQSKEDKAKWKEIFDNILNKQKKPAKRTE